MELRQIETFFWIASLGSFGAAAKHLNATQPAISGRIIALERELGVSLFDRTGRHVKLTRKGMEIFDHAERVVKLIGAIKEIARGDGNIRGTVRLGVVNTIAHTWLPHLIRQIHARYPAIDVDFQVNTGASLRAMLESHDLDLIITVGPFPAPGVKCNFLCRYSFDWIASAEMDLAHERTTLKEIARHRIITYPKKTAQYNVITQLFRSHGIWPIRLSGSNSVAAMVKLALENIGVCAIPAVVVAEKLATGELRVLHTDEPLPPIEFFVSYLIEPFNEVAALLAEIAVAVAREFAEMTISSADESSSQLSI